VRFPQWSGIESDCHLAEIDWQWCERNLFFCSKKEQMKKFSSAFQRQFYNMPSLTAILKE
jgi:hypothetical protein